MSASSGNGSLTMNDLMDDEWSFTINVLGPNVAQLRDILRGIPDLTPAAPEYGQAGPSIQSPFVQHPFSPHAPVHHQQFMPSSPATMMQGFPLAPTPANGFFSTPTSANGAKRKRGRPTREETNARLMASLQQQMQSIQAAQPRQLQQPTHQFNHMPAQPQQPVPQFNQTPGQVQQPFTQFYAAGQLPQPVSQFYAAGQLQQSVQQLNHTGLKCRVCYQPTADSIISGCGHFVCNQCGTSHITINKTCPGCMAPCTLDMLRKVRS